MIRDVIDALSPLERKTLEYAADNNIAQFIKLDEGKFVAVYVERMPHLKIEEQAGVWAYGSMPL